MAMIRTVALLLLALLNVAPAAAVERVLSFTSDATVQRNGDNLNFDDKHVSLGIDQAEAVYAFGDVERPMLQLHLGTFCYKYNPDVRNLGEYLFRSGPYPNYILNGGFLAVGDNAAYMEGFQASAHLGGLTLDLLLITGDPMPPLNPPMSWYSSPCSGPLYGTRPSTPSGTSFPAPSGLPCR